MLARPFSVVFANRQTTMAWTTILSFVLLAVMYLLTARLLGTDVASPIDRTNSSLAKITDGDLDVKVEEHGNVEFSSLSSGINNTVDALKGYIAEAETRISSTSLRRASKPFSS
jgi:methyl-accepting chemotaxis protein